MSGIKYLLDTNYILGLLQSNQAVLSEAISKNILVTESAYSPITRTELLGFPGITSDEDNLIRVRLQSFTVIPLSTEIEDSVIALRQTRKIKLPDAMIAATALVTKIELLTLDQHLKSVVTQQI
ncbi:MAG: type II toxin-antitoxin system VapC family toxin [Methylotenera sp.]|nr:type II toxin-antitoxin system VapC family toxin [Methylotenera sp.]MDD4926195.1 type II toxin-antitoxin system VapC family toxin [Methylotenera sp.]